MASQPPPRWRTAGAYRAATIDRLLEERDLVIVPFLASAKSVPNVGQAELDEIDVGVSLRDDDIPVVFPLEAKAADEVSNRVQVATAVTYCQTYFPGHEIRPIVIKLTYDGVLHFLEFRATTALAGLRVVHSCGYRLKSSRRQLELIRATRATLDREAVEPPKLEISGDLASIEIEGSAE